MTIAEEDLTPQGGEEPSKPGRSFEDFGRFELAQRAKTQSTIAARSERLNFDNHLLTAEFAPKHIADISAADIEKWWRLMGEKQANDRQGVRPLSAETQDKCRYLLSAIFRAADEQGLLRTNPFDSVKIKRAERKDQAPDAYLDLDEQNAIESSETIDNEARLQILFAIGTGVSLAEQFNLNLSDLHLEADPPYVTVRVGVDGRQKDESHTAYLLGPAPAAAREWRRLLPGIRPNNPRKLLFPSPRGQVKGSKPLGRSDALKRILRTAGIRKEVSWRDLRHTCAISMGLGYWGRRYTLEEIRAQLGVEFLSVERYHPFVRGTLGATGPVASRQRGGEGRASSFVDADVSATTSTRASEKPVPAPSVDVPEPAHWRADHVELDTESAVSASPLSLRRETYARAATALATGKHLLLVGAPGTGKTELAHALVNAAKNAGYCSGGRVATASADWTTFDTIGGYAVQRTGQLHFRPGAVLQAVRAFEWLIIDELNRADVDRAFGELMTVLAGRTADTGYELDDGTPVRIGRAAEPPYQMPGAFRVIATMNTWDKTSLFGLSYAVQRRFAVIHVDVPEDPQYGELIARHATDASYPPSARVSLGTEAVRVLTLLFSNQGLLGVREIGPAIAIDLIRYARRRVGASSASFGDAVAEGIVMFILPQLEGLEHNLASRAHQVLTDALATAGASELASKEFLVRFRALLPHVDLVEDA